MIFTLSNSLYFQNQKFFFFVNFWENFSCQNSEETEFKIENGWMDFLLFSFVCFIKSPPNYFFFVFKFIKTLKTRIVNNIIIMDVEKKQTNSISQNDAVGLVWFGLVFFKLAWFLSLLLPSFNKDDDDDDDDDDNKNNNNNNKNNKQTNKQYYHYLLPIIISDTMFTIKV